MECHFGDSFVDKALADSSASINVMPYKLFLKLAIQDLEPIESVSNLLIDPVDIHKVS